jgi:hypothetical protein
MAELEPEPEPEPEPELELLPPSEPDPEPEPEPEMQPASEPEFEPQQQLEPTDLELMLAKAAELLATATTEADPADAKAHYQGSLAMFEAALAYVEGCVSPPPSPRPLSQLPSR